MRWFATLLGLMLLGWAEPTWASGDAGCSAAWKLTVKEMTGCDSRLVLGPGNDTRVNLFLLLRERHHMSVQPPAPVTGETLLQPHFEWMVYRDVWQPPVPPSDDFLTGEDSRCRSNTGGKADFAAAVRAARGLTEAERTALVAARNGFNPDCGAQPAVLAPVTATLAKPWADYLRAAAAFYGGDFAGAAPAFVALTRVSDPWLTETARYMIARVALNQAQVHAYTDYGEADFTKVDKPALARAQAGFTAYLHTYPTGRYATSARGLLRRVWWLGGDTTRLAAAYAALLAQPAATRGIDDFDLVQEVDNKLRPATLDAINDPLLLAMFDLAKMRGEEGATLDAATLARQRPAFAHEPDLYSYLQAAFALYVANKPADVLRLNPDATRERAIGTLALSRQVLRGQALDAVHDGNARGFWLQLLPATATSMQRSVVELGLALHEERAGHLDALLAPGSPLTLPLFRETLLFSVADAALLRRAAQSPALPKHERETALFQLLYKELTRGFYADFGRDVAMVPVGAPSDVSAYDGLISIAAAPVGVFTQTKRLGDLGCPPLRQTAATLAANPRDPHARLCVADFIQANNFDGGTYDFQPPADELGGSHSLFPGAPFKRATVYRDLIANAATPPDDKAYALYRAIRCYAPSGSSDCGDDVPIATRKAWFLRLKHDYPRSRWAQASDLYW